MTKQFTKIHFVRHAQSISNKEDRLSGGEDDAFLTDLGEKQASDRGKALLPHKDNISYIVHSDMIRTSQTTDGINKWLNLKVKHDTNLREQDFGTLEGKKLSEVKKLIDASSKSKNAAFVEYGAEDESIFKDRVKTSFCKYFQSGEEEILLVSHGIYGKRAYEIFYDKQHGFKNAEHVIFDPAVIDVAGKCGLIDLDL